MKRIFGVIKELGIIIFNFFLIIVAIVLIIITTIPAFIWLLAVSFTNKDRKPDGIVYGISAYFLAIASSLDKFGNVAFGGFWNDLLLKTVCYSFGYNYETISQVVGWNKLFGSLSETGELLYSTLNKLEKDHCELAVVSGITTSYLRLEKYEKLKGSNPDEWKKIDVMVQLALQDKGLIRIDSK